MLKFRYEHKNQSGEVRVPSTENLIETYPPCPPPRTVLIAMDGSEDSKFAFYCE